MMHAQHMLIYSPTVDGYRRYEVTSRLSCETVSVALSEAAGSAGPARNGIRPVKLQAVIESGRRKLTWGVCMAVTVTEHHASIDVQVVLRT